MTATFGLDNSFDPNGVPRLDAGHQSVSAATPAGWPRYPMTVSLQNSGNPLSGSATLSLTYLCR